MTEVHVRMWMDGGIVLWEGGYGKSMGRKWVREEVRWRFAFDRRLAFYYMMMIILIARVARERGNWAEDFFR